MVDPPGPCERVFLDWAKPALPQAAAWLLDHPTGSHQKALKSGLHGEDSQRVCPAEIDLSDFVCILPGRRAGRALLLQLATQATQRGLALTPPIIATPGSMVESAADRALPTATETEVLLAWRHAVRDVDPKWIGELMSPPRENRKVIGPIVHSEDNADALARIAQRLRRELAAEGRQFKDAVTQCELLERQREAERWKALTAIEERYRARLAATSLIDPDDAQRQLIQSLTSGKHCILIGVSDLTSRQRDACDRVRCTALIHAPQSLADHFDAFGAVIPERWSQSRIDIDEAAIVPVDSVTHQAQEVLHQLSALDGEFDTSRIIIGLGEESDAERIRVAGLWADVRFRSAAGVAMERSSVSLLIHLLGEWMSSRTFVAFAELIRHPDLERWLSSTLSARGVAAWESLLDRYMNDHVQQRPTEQWLGKEPTRSQLADVWNAVSSLVEPLVKAKTLKESAAATDALLDTIYGAEVGHPITESALENVRAVVESIAASEVPPPDALDPAAFLQLIDELTRGESIRVPPDDEIEMVGWLELALDESPVLIITGVNEGSVPASVHADAFLPDGLRTRLGLLNDARRHARDAYLLTAMLRSREYVRLIVPRQNDDGSPRLPSRLLLQCSQDQLLPRLKRLQIADLPMSDDLIGLKPAAISTDTVPPLPQNLEPVESMRVTDFRRYLECPYRFALDRIIRLEEIGDREAELTPIEFGNALHQVLERFGRSDESVRFSTDPKRIEEFVFDSLDTHARERFGGFPPPAIRVQLARLRQRLRGFAIHQSKLAREGWRIVKVESKLPSAMLELPGETPMSIHGTVDRIDQFRDEPRYRLMDYKSSDSGTSPFMAHHGRDNPRTPEHWERWVDLQLPLYAHFAPLLACEGEIETGYFNLPKGAERVEFVAAPWEASHLAHAITIAQQIVRDIRAGRFDPNPEYQSDFDSYRRILRTTVWRDDEGSREEAE